MPVFVSPYNGKVWLAERKDADNLIFSTIFLTCSSRENVSKPYIIRMYIYLTLYIFRVSTNLYTFFYASETNLYTTLYYVYLKSLIFLKKILFLRDFKISNSKVNYVQFNNYEILCELYHPHSGE